MGEKERLALLADAEHAKYLEAASRLQTVREIAEHYVGAPCSCNAIAYQILRALDGKKS